MKVVEVRLRLITSKAYSKQTNSNCGLIPSSAQEEYIPDKSHNRLLPAEEAELKERTEAVVI